MSCKKCEKNADPISVYKKIAILIPAYREDKVIPQIRN